MVQRRDVGARSVAKVLALLALGALTIGASGGCTDLPGGLGASCLKNQDCQSGVCSELVCAAAPPLLDAQFMPGDGSADATLDTTSPSADGGQTDASSEGSTGPDSEPPDGPEVVDSSVPVDAPVDSSTQDAPEVAHPDAAIDAPADVTTDALGDGRADGGEAG
jgi:hypothetical protein